MFLLTGLITITALGQNITGQWNGILKVQGIQFRVIFNINNTDNGYSATMESLDQGVKGIPVMKTTFQQSQISMEVTRAAIEYHGEPKEKIISGTYKQDGKEYPIGS